MSNKVFNTNLKNKQMGVGGLRPQPGVEPLHPHLPCSLFIALFKGVRYSEGAARPTVPHISVLHPSANRYKLGIIHDSQGFRRFPGKNIPSILLTKLESGNESSSSLVLCFSEITSGKRKP
ncbi:MAG: hypothetical protein WCA35_10335, partial [Kovacikia sp.]